MSRPINLSDKYWQGLSAEHQAMYAVIQPMPTPAHTFDCRIHDLENSISTMQRDCEESGGTFELNPDFQRGHVWNQSQQIAYTEALLRKTAPARILFNCPGWSRASSARRGDISDNHMQCIDGLQRLTAVLEFMRGAFMVFGRYKADDLKGSPFEPRQYTLQFAVHEFPDRAQLLRFYLNLNQGGTVHSGEELARVRALLASTQEASNE